MVHVRSIPPPLTQRRNLINPPEDEVGSRSEDISTSLMLKSKEEIGVKSEIGFTDLGFANVDLSKQDFAHGEDGIFRWNWI